MLTRIRCPFLNTLLVAQRSTVSGVTSPGFNSTGFSLELRYRARKIPSMIKIERPSGQTSVSFATKSVSSAVEETCN